MVRRRSQLIPWRVAGGVADEHANADQVVRETGWVFNNETGAALTLEDFVMSGNKEVNAYLRVFGMNEMNLEELSVLEIGSGIGRMTSRLTHRFGTVIAADVDATFLERCRETVAKHGVINRLRTAHVTDGHTVPLADNSVDAVFSYITLAALLQCRCPRIDEGIITCNKTSWCGDAELPHVGARRYLFAAHRSHRAGAVENKSVWSMACQAARGNPLGLAGKPGLHQRCARCHPSFGPPVQ
jgi:SAM-dependent methyltransferase